MKTELFPSRVLAVGAHPDDLEIQCAGTLAAYTQMGVQVSMAVVTDGSAGHMLIPPSELIQTRHREAEAAAKTIGANFYWLGFHDELLPNDIATRMTMVDLIRQTRPDVIFTHHPLDYHPDHRVTSHLIFDASFVASLPNIKTETPAHTLVPPLYYYDTMGGLHFEPTDFVDITEFIDQKTAMLSCHTSQVQWLKDHDNIDILEQIKTTALYRGIQCAVRYAEGFRCETAYPRSRTYRIIP